ncbi:MAG: hypothetical protein K0R39_440 [Symbiobacteriaceae bacterium]|jgi:hypothetical protein|nr:hypothetical protein [Symbiobacteriaceae bacterium]
MSWQREYKGAGTTFPAVILGLVFLFIGAVFTILMGWVGLLIVAVGIALPVLVLWLGRQQTIICNDQGFTVRHASRRSGTNEVTYAWHEVTATQYYERRVGAEGQRRGHFAVDTVRGRAFVVTQGMRNFADLIDLVNHMTIQLPYVWVSRVGFALKIGPATVGREAYQAVPREQVARR